jgi:hypothetical protein
MLGYVDKEQHEYRVIRQIDFKSIMSGKHVFHYQSNHHYFPSPKQRTRTGNCSVVTLQINAYHFQPLTGNNSMQKLRKYALFETIHSSTPPTITANRKNEIFCQLTEFQITEPLCGHFYNLPSRKSTEIIFECQFPAYDPT